MLGAAGAVLPGAPREESDPIPEPPVPVPPLPEAPGLPVPGWPDPGEFGKPVPGVAGRL